MKKNIVSIVVASVILAGCNTPPSRIAANHYTGNGYQNYDCKKLLRELANIDSTVSAQRSQLQSDANTDAAIVGGSLLILPVGLIGLAFTGNGDLKSQYADNLGKQKALRQQIDDKEC